MYVEFEIGDTIFGEKNSFSPSVLNPSPYYSPAKKYAPVRHKQERSPNFKARNANA